MLQITSRTSPLEISEYIKSLREQKGKEKETLEAINKALVFGHDFVINLFWEEALTYQHMVMSNSNDKKSIAKMEESVLKARFYIEKYKLSKWYSRLDRFLGRVCDYKNEFKKSVNFYKKAIKFSKLDSEPFRDLELNGFLSYALVMSGKINQGYKLAKKTFDNFGDSPDGKKLKKSDYQAWAIWRSGIAIRTIDAFITKNIDFDNQCLTPGSKRLRMTYKNRILGIGKKNLKLLNKNYLTVHSIETPPSARLFASLIFASNAGSCTGVLVPRTTSVLAPG